MSDLSNKTKMSKKVYFISDFHLGLDAQKSSDERETLIVNWLQGIKDNTEALYLVGDVFDYWFEYNKVIPKGYHRLFAVLSDFRQSEIPVYFFTGNHDMWMFKFFEDEFGIPIYRKPQAVEHFGYKIYVGHGDGLGPGDYGYKTIKAIFGNPICQWLFARIHPNTGIRLMKYFSQKSRLSNEDDRYFGPEKERLIIFCEEHNNTNNFDYYVFGHRHLPIDHTLKDGKTRYVNIGDWINYYSFAELDTSGLTLKFAFDDSHQVYGHRPVLQSTSM